MSQGRSGHAFYVVYLGEVRIVPTAKSINNTFDYMGMLVGLNRLPGERNATYRGRLADVHVNQAGAHYTGLINGITRELGLAQYDAITITSSLDYPRIEVGDTYINIWTSTSEYETIDIYLRDSTVYTLDDLVVAINAISGYTATLAVGGSEFTPAAQLLVRDSLIWVNDELLSSTHRNLLENKPVTPGSIKFSRQGSTIFATRQLTEAAVTEAGDYYVDYTEGLIVSYTLSAIDVTCRYSYSEFPITLRASPVKVMEFNSPTLRENIFYQVLGPDDLTTMDGLPKSEAVDYINELLAAKGMLWGR